MPDLVMILIAVAIVAAPAVCTCLCANYANKARRAKLAAEGVVQRLRQQ